MSGLVRAVEALLIGGSCIWLAPSAAHACKFAGPPPSYEVSPAAQAEDDVAPTPFTNVDAMVWRREGRTCELGQCTSNSCGDMGHVELFFDPPQDDRTPVEELGFRIEVLEGTLPSSLQASMTRAQALEDAVRFHLGFDEATRMDATIALVAIDRAGNESPASNPVRLKFSGCTKPAAGRLCKEGGPLACRAASGGTGWAGVAWMMAAGLWLRLRGLNRRASSRRG